jgi:hypothetical protein
MDQGEVIINDKTEVPIFSPVKVIVSCTTKEVKHIANECLQKGCMISVLETVVMFRLQVSFFVRVRK